MIASEHTNMNNSDIKEVTTMDKVGQTMNTLSRLVDAQVAIEKERVRCDIRLSHLELQGKTCEDTAAVRDQLLGTEHWIEERIAALIKEHPAYSWFSRIKGVGSENIAKCIAPVRIKLEQGYRKNKSTKKLELVDLPFADTISGVWSFSGMGLDGDGKAMKPKKGEPLPYNSDLRSMWWRLGSSILKAGLRQKCSKCGELVGQAATKPGSPSEHKCTGAEFTTVAITEFSNYYLREKEKAIQQFLNKGWKIVPASGLPRDSQKKKYEPEGIISEGHIHNRALRKMIKLFQACLFLVWREAEGLPPTKPYAIDKLGHDSMIEPWKMVDREEPA